VAFSHMALLPDSGTGIVPDSPSMLNDRSVNEDDG
jgi:hypothetical protein